MALGDNLNRVAKILVDSGEAPTVERAVDLLREYALTVEIGPEVARSPTLQAAVLTAVNAGRRCFLGGVQVVGDVDVDLKVPWRRCGTLRGAIADLRGEVVHVAAAGRPRMIVGDVEDPALSGGIVVRATFEGWSAGVVPLDSGRRLPERQEFTPSGVLAGALAVSEAFQSLRGNVLAGRREVGLSLWRLEESATWASGAAAGPELERLPSRLWIIGLGHLGQAFLWTLGFLPYADAGDLELVLQDYDTLVNANDSTSLLTTPGIVGEKKTRAMARWCEQRGFRTTITERRFAADFRVSSDEPAVALCGVDNARARAALEYPGFSRVIEAGLGGGTREYLDFQMHTFPAGKSARERWGRAAQEGSADGLLKRPAYKALASEGLDQCGLTTLAGRTVGAPFVGAAVSAIVVAETLRMVLGYRQYEAVDGSLRSLGEPYAFPKAVDEPFNPGSASARS
jgi:hypothetical protein